MNQREYFASKVVWITGASSGIGEALAMAAAGHGATLILSARREPELKRVAAACGLTPEKIKILLLDLETRDELAAKADEAWRMFGRIDILINNAGLGQRGTALETEPATTRKIMEVNFFGTINLTRALLPRMVERGHGQVVVISSVLGKFGARNRSAYAASKHALHGYFDSLRAEVHDQGIRVTMICPGYIRTSISLAALGPDGTAHGRMDEGQARGMAPDKFARKALAAIAARRREVCIGSLETNGTWLARLCPGLLALILRKIRMR